MKTDANEVTRRLAEFAVQLRDNDLPQSVRDEALRGLFNIVGCTVGGARHESVEIVDTTLDAGTAQATMLGRGRRASLLHCALINCLASSVYSFDDTHEKAVVHPAGPVAAAVLALAEQRTVTGAAALTAFALGVEYICRLSMAISVPPAKGTIAWSQTGIAGASVPRSQPDDCSASTAPACKRRSGSHCRKPPASASCTARWSRH